MSQQHQLHTILPILQSQSDNAISLTMEEWEELFKKLMDYFVSTNSRGKALKTDAIYLKIVDMMTYQFFGGYSEGDTQAWSDEYTPRARFDLYLLNIITVFAEHVNPRTLVNSQSIKSIIARIISFVLTNGQFGDEQSQRNLDTEEPQGETVSPILLRERAIQLLVAVVRALVDTITASQYLGDCVDVVRLLLDRCMKTLTDMANLLTNLTFPSYVGFICLSPPAISENPSFDPFLDEDENSRICIRDRAQLSVHLHDLLQIQTQCLSVISHWSFETYNRDTIQIVIHIVDSLLSGGLEGVGPKALSVLESCLVAIRLMGKQRVCSRYREALGCTIMGVLRLRYRIGPRSEWARIDTALLKVLDDDEVYVMPSIMSSGIFEVLSKEEWGFEGELLRECAYAAISSGIKTLGQSNVRQHYEMLSHKPRSERLVRLLSTLEANFVDARGGEIDGAPFSVSVLSKEQVLWKETIIRTVLPFIRDEDKGRVVDMESDNSTYETWCIATITSIMSILSSSTQTHLDDSDDIVETAKSLTLLPCHIVHPHNDDCNKRSSSYMLPLLDLVTTCFNALTDRGGSNSETLHRLRFEAITRSIQHQATGYDFHLITSIALDGMKHDKRTVRIVAGRLLRVVLESNEHSEPAFREHTNSIFEEVSELLCDAIDPLRETTIVFLGLCGKSRHAYLVDQCTIILVKQLGQTNALLRSTAFSQLIALSRYHGRTTYALALPNLQHIALSLLASSSQHHSTLNETCRLLMTTPVNLLTNTLAQTLPVVFSNCDDHSLDRLEAVLGRSTPDIFSDYVTEVLVAIYLREGDSTDDALRFLQDRINRQTHYEFNVVHALKDYTWKILAELVIVMGHESLDRANLAVSAIMKVQTTLQADPAYQHFELDHVGSALVENLLGIVTHLTEMVQSPRQPDEVRIQVLRGLGRMITEVGFQVVTVAPQIMATLQTTIRLESLSEATLSTWLTFVKALDLNDLAAVIGQVSAAIVDVWPLLSINGRLTGREILEYAVLQRGDELGGSLDTLIDLSQIPELFACADHLRILRGNDSAKTRLSLIIERLFTDNVSVIHQSLEELRQFMVEISEVLIRSLTSGDVFDPVIGSLVKVLLSVACRDGEERIHLRSLALECIGILGAIDPDRFDIPHHEESTVVMKDFADEAESLQFSMHMIEDILIGAYRTTSDSKYQSEIAFAIQELLKVCGFTTDLVNPGGEPVPLKVRARWNKLPKHVLDTITPLLASKFALPDNTEFIAERHPIYHAVSTYREWIQTWASHLISKASGTMARRIFKVFRAVVRNNDVGVTQQILPHLALNVLMSGNDEDVSNMRAEITTVLEDQLDTQRGVLFDKKRSSAQMIFTIMDHFNKWLCFARLEIAMRRQEAGANSRRSRQPQTALDLQILRVDSILASIDQKLVARAAFECNSFARSLMNYENYITMIQSAGAVNSTLQECFERLHEIYAHLDEPDGMEGVSSCVMIPSLEHHIRQHEIMGRWTSAQSCWEIRLQQSPDNLDYHIGLLRCLRNLGHYDSLRTHIQGVLVRNPQWEENLTAFRVEGALMAKDWTAVQRIVCDSKNRSSEVAIARVFLAIRSGDEASVSKALSEARSQIGIPFTTTGDREYRRAYDVVLDLHVLKDIETIHRLTSVDGGTRVTLAQLNEVLRARFEATLPTFRTREPILNMHRVAFSLSSATLAPLGRYIGAAWLSSAKIARKAGQWQTAYSAVLQARECNAPMSFVQSAKLVKATGEPLRALYELDIALQNIPQDQHEVPSLSQSEVEEKDRVLAKAKLLRVRWMRESERFDSSTVLKDFSELSRTYSSMESAYFHAGHFQDELYNNLSRPDKKSRGHKMVLFTVKQYARSLRFGSKYTYETIPRLLTLWLDMGEDAVLSNGETFPQINREMDNAIKHTPVYKWLTAFPQIVSRVDHRNNQSYALLSKLILTVMQEYPLQSLWLFMSVVKSTKPRREKRGVTILEQLKSLPHNNMTNVPSLVDQAINMATELLRLCDAPIKDNDAKTLSMTRDFPHLKRQAPSNLIIPLQESLTVNLPATSSHDSDHQPFPLDAPRFYQFLDEVEVMKSLAKPRKITIVGTNSEQYIFLGKPKDDLRKDARLMDFNAIINKILRSNSDSRRRRLYIRTYSVVTLNEECGFIQWVPNTTPVRPILMKYYSGKGIDSWNREMSLIFQRIKDASDKEAAVIFRNEILKLFPCVFHQWFLDQFPEPTTWLSSRLAYSRTAAVISMVGFILGLGDRHLENILLDVNTGDVVHVDFNCLFERGKTLETPERVPFRLTQNIVDGFGVTGVEGVFRIACEISMQLLRANKDVLMNVLDAFIHDPLVEWEDEKRRRERQVRNSAREPIDPRRFAKEALDRIKQKLQGMYVKDNNPNERRDKEIATNNLVQLLIEESTDLRNLAKMYPGWAPWH